jgi:hypothetical protein
MTVDRPMATSSMSPPVPGGALSKTRSRTGRASDRRVWPECGKHEGGPRGHAWRCRPSARLSARSGRVRPGQARCERQRLSGLRSARPIREGIGGPFARARARRRASVTSKEVRPTRGCQPDDHAGAARTMSRKYRRSNGSARTPRGSTRPSPQQPFACAARPRPHASVPCVQGSLRRQAITDHRSLCAIMHADVLTGWCVGRFRLPMIMARSPPRAGRVQVAEGAQRGGAERRTWTRSGTAARYPTIGSAPRRSSTVLMTSAERPVQGSRTRRLAGARRGVESWLLAGPVALFSS